MQYDRANILFLRDTTLLQRARQLNAVARLQRGLSKGVLFGVVHPFTHGGVSSTVLCGARGGHGAGWQRRGGHAQRPVGRLPEG